MESVEARRVSAPVDRAAWWRLAMALVPAYPVIVLLADSRALPALKIETALVLLVTTLRPSAGLLMVAALAPLGDMLIPLLGGRPVAHAETIVLAFVAGWLASTAVDRGERSSLAPAVGVPAFVFGAVVVASAFSTAIELHRVSPEEFHQTIRGLADGYLNTSDVIGAHAAANLLEGLAILLATAEIVRGKERLRVALAITLVAGGVLGAIGSALLAKGIAPAATLARQRALDLPRFAATATDVNAVASWYVLLLGIAAGIVFDATMQRRSFAIVACVLLLAGIGLTGSRGAFIAVGGLVCVAGLIRARRARSRTVRQFTPVAILVAIAITVTFTATRSAASSVDMRAGFTVASVRMIAARPVFGVGIGRYYALSEFVLPPSLGWLYGHENAHDYYLQLAAELGLVGAAMFGWLVAAALAAATQRARVDGLMMWTGLLAGSCGYLVTAIGGHPLLVPETALPFWGILGAASARIDRRSTAARSRRVAAVAVAIVALTIPFRPGTPRVRVPADDDGFGPVQRDSNGTVFRRVNAYASAFVPPSVTAIEIRLRSSTPVRVGVAVAGWSRGEIIVGTSWSQTPLTLPGASGLEPYQRINFAVPGTGAAPVPQVDIGELKIVSARR